MNKKVLYISYDGMTDPLGQSQVLPYLAGLSVKGLEFHLISFEKTEKLASLGTTIQLICDQAGIHWHPVKYTKKPPVLSTLWDIAKMYRKAFRLQEEHSFEVVHCRSYIAALAGMALKKRRGLKFIFDMRGFWADERVEGNIWKLSNPLMKQMYKFFKKKELQFFTNADYIVSLTENGKQEIKSWKIFADKSLRIKVIPCCVDMELFYPPSIDETARKDLKKRFQLKEDAFVLGYIGSIGTWYMLPEMLDYFKVLKSCNTKAKFLFVTGEKPSLIHNEALKKEIDIKDILVVSCAHKEVPLYVSIFDQSVFFIRPTYSKKASSPTKQGEIMAMGIPVICNAGVGDTDYIVNHYEAGTIISSFSLESYKEIMENEKEYDKNKMIRGAQEFFSLDRGVEKYLEIYEAIL